MVMGGITQALSPSQASKLKSWYPTLIEGNQWVCIGEPGETIKWKAEGNQWACIGEQWEISGYRKANGYALESQGETSGWVSKNKKIAVSQH